MRKQICSLALSTLFGLGIAVAAPQAGPPAAPQAQDQSAPPQNAPEAGHRDTGRGNFDPNRQAHILTKRLNLTDDQQKQLLPILTSRRDQMESLRSDTSLAPQDRHAKMRSIREASDTQIRALLNDTQKQAYDQMQQQMREREQQRREERQNPNGGNQ